MTHKILIIKSGCRKNKTCEYNRGSFSVLMTTVDTIKKFMPDAELSTYIQFSEEKPLSKKIKVIKNESYCIRYYSLSDSIIMTFYLFRCIVWNIFDKIGINFHFLIKSKFLSNFESSDLVIDLSLDAYSDDYGLRSIVETSKELLISVFLNKPTMVYAQSLGPFKNPISRLLARYTLNKVDLISAREEISYNHLIELGINKQKIHLTADQAFLLVPISRDKALKFLEQEDKHNYFDLNKPIFGFALSMMKTAKDGASKKSKFLSQGYSFVQYILPDTLLYQFNMNIHNSNYFKKTINNSLNFDWMNLLIEHIIRKYDANIILIPHIIAPPNELFSDDRTAIEKIYNNINESEKQHVIPITGYYASEEIKGIIGLCDVFIGEKMHANVGALSQCVPTIGLSYSHKFYGIMKMLGQEEYVMQSVDVDTLISKVDQIWKNKENIRNDLNHKMIQVRNMAEENGKLAASLLDN